MTMMLYEGLREDGGRAERWRVCFVQTGRVLALEVAVVPFPLAIAS